ncbi:MAG: carboxypeptidase regulatory-like domain-containing protein [Lachnospiraceae bacterium]|nr:carboxypeptidase regulatory-like domain-containing protein [Lachnospiraceae bacterium]
MKKYRAAIIIAAAITLAACGTETTEADLPKVSEETSEVKSEEPSKTEAASEKKQSDKADTATIYPDRDYAEDIDEKLAASSADNYVRTRGSDSGSGDIVDTSIFKIKGDIVRIITEDYGSDGLITSEYYYNNGNVAFMKQHKTDIYGINSTYTEADLSDIEADYTTGVLEQADNTLTESKKNTGKALLYGYAGDEQGGVLANVNVKLRNLAGDVNMETVTDGDGYYTFELPQTDETYNLTYTYGSYLVSSLNDVHIVPGTPEYSLGRVYVAPEGHAVHDTDVYLLNANTKPPVKLKDGEYAVVLTSDVPDISMKLVSRDDQSYETGNQIKIDPSKSKAGYVLFVEDDANLSKDDMSGNMGRSNINVTIFDKDGIVAAYLMPVGRLGTIWRVCDINSAGDISVSGIMYTDASGWNWLE